MNGDLIAVLLLLVIGLIWIRIDNMIDCDNDSASRKYSEFKIDDEVYVMDLSVYGKVTSRDTEFNVYIKLNNEVPGVNSGRVVRTPSQVRKIYAYKPGDRVYHLRKASYGSVDCVSLKNGVRSVSVTFDNKKDQSYISHPYELVPVVKGEEQQEQSSYDKRKKKFFYGDKVQFTNYGELQYMVVFEEDDRVKLINIKSKAIIYSSKFCLDKIGELDPDEADKLYNLSASLHSSNYNSRNRIENQGETPKSKLEDPRFAVMASWFNGKKRVYRVISVQHLVHMLRQRQKNEKKKLSDFRAVMYRTGIVYPGTNRPQEEDRTHFEKLYKKAEELYAKT